MNADFLAALLDPGRPVPAELAVRYGAAADRRFAVYRNNVIVSLIDVLADAFPVTRALVGEGFFREMARCYVRVEPPRDPVLACYGRSFPDFISAFGPAAPTPYLADVARLEVLRVEALHAADAAPIPPADLERAIGDAATLPVLTMTLHPSARLLRAPCAAVSIWAAHQGGGDLAGVEVCAAESALILRPGLEVAVIPLPDAAADFIARIQAGARLGQALADSRASFPDFDPTVALSLLLRYQAITALPAPNDR